MNGPAAPLRTSPAELEALILALLAEAAPGKSIDPGAVARAALPGDAAWHRLMPSVRAAAVRLARGGRITVLRKGKPADPDDFKGLYRLALPEPLTGRGRATRTVP